MRTRRMRLMALPVLALLWNQAVYYGGGFLGRWLPPLHMGTAADQMVPFLPWTVAVYFGCYLGWAAVYILCAGQKDSAAAYRFFLADFLAKGVCLVCFLLLPATLARPVPQGSDLWSAMVRFLYRIDPPRNLFPSIHCLVSWLCFLGIRDRRGLPPWAAPVTAVGAMLVCLSTLTTRQHVAVDVLAGIALAELSYRTAGHPALLGPFTRLADRLLAPRPQSRA